MPYRILILSMSARMIAEPSGPQRVPGSSQPASLRIVMPGHLDAARPWVSGEAPASELGSVGSNRTGALGSAWVIGLSLHSMVLWRRFLINFWSINCIAQWSAKAA
jgi:hypothetical protein